ncbi:hypothetical protein BH10ACT1_BH10ACT1_02590 [soil metagenome]
MAVVVFVVVANASLSGLQSMVGNEPGGPTSSAYSTGGSGLEGYADLLRAQGHPVRRLQQSPASADLPVTATVVVADASGLGQAEAERLARFVAGGGRLVVAGESSGPLVQALAGADVRWRSVGPVDELAVWVPGDATGSARTLAGDEGGRWTGTGALVPVAGAEDQAAILAGPVGEGRLLAVADASLLQNARLPMADNAALGLALAGPATRPVVFVEAVSGRAGSGLSAVPSAWKWVTAGLAIAMLAGIWAAGARFGPPEPQRRALRPPRRDHVDAVAADLDRVTSTPAEAVGPLALATRRALAQHLGVAADASPGVLLAAAERGGVDPRQIDLLAIPTPDLDAALAIGALSALRQQHVHGRSGGGAGGDGDDRPAAPAPDSTGATP